MFHLYEAEKQAKLILVIKFRIAVAPTASGCRGSLGKGHKGAWGNVIPTQIKVEKISFLHCGPLCFKLDRYLVVYFNKVCTAALKNRQ